jgi:uncharacterized protein YbcI
MDAQQAPSAHDGSPPHLSELSNAMVRIYKEQFGRGPTRARTHYAGSDIIVCTLEETLTPAERKLVEMGENQRMRDSRMFMQYATVRDFIDTVEGITGRKVRAFVSGIDAEQDVSSEVFYLEPDGVRASESGVAAQ